MYVNNIIKKATIGSLVLLINYKRPTKSGWWRLIHDGKLGHTYLMLEKPLHKYFDVNDEDISFTHKEKGVYVMRLSGVFDSTDCNEGKYEVLAVVKGVECILLSNNDYKLCNVVPYEDLEKNKNIFCSNKFKEVKHMFYKEINKNKLETIVADFV